jgi:glutamate-ammonia-ligase adenylyltransferase
VSENELGEFEARHGLPGLAERLEALCAVAPDPGAARGRAAAVIAAAAEARGDALRDAWQRAPTELARALAALAGSSPFLCRRLIRTPGPWLELADDALEQPRPAEAFVGRLEAALAGAPAEALSARLRRFKYDELVRITVRDAAPGLVPLERVGEVLAELSHLADALLAGALAAVSASVTARFGPPRWQRADGGEVTLGFCVLGLGKLGGEELNYSSDVDLVYVYESPPLEAQPLGDGPGGLPPSEYFARLARDFGPLVAGVEDEGFLYRVDLDLRPEGGQGPIVVSHGALVTYHDAWAASWEKAAYMKARPVAGDLDFGWRVVRGLDPMLYRSAMDFEAVDAIRTMKERIEAESRASVGDNVKLGPGGIRDVEFVAQALQLLHGGRAPQVRGRSTQAALEALAEVDALPRELAAQLLGAYRFLRRVENRLQMEEERQTHRMPRDEAARRRLARAAGFTEGDELAAFDAALEAHRGAVRAAFEELLAPGGGERVARLFAAGASRLLAMPSTRAMMDDLSQRFAREIETSADPELALQNLDRFVRGIGTQTSYWGLLVDRPELVPRLAALFGSSRYLAELFAAHPDLIEPVFRDPGTLLLDREQLERDFAEIRGELAQATNLDPAEIGLAALRRFRHRQLVNVGLLDLAGKVSSPEAHAALAEIAEVCLERGLELAREQLGATRAGRIVPDLEFLAVGMGKLGSRELTYGSDLDVIFLYDAERLDDERVLEAQEASIRLAQKLVWALSTRTAQGFCYAVDPELRPSGQQGMLVTSLASFRAYHAKSAQAWERQALLRARPVAGSRELGARFEEARRAILLEAPPDDLAAEIHRLRMRMERERAKERAGRRDFKTGRGGLVDVEFAVQYLQLTNGAEHPELLAPEPIAWQLERLEALGLLAPDAAKALREGWDFLTRLAARLRVVENRSSSDLDEERADLESVSRALGYTPSSRGGGARRPLLEDYRRHTEAIREVYLAVIGEAAA